MNPNKIIAGVYVYGAARTIMYAPPLKPEDYITHRIARVLLFTTAAPFYAPYLICKDLHNLEHKLRKMPGPIDRFPWEN
jgi:hypothetical protein